MQSNSAAPSSSGNPAAVGYLMPIIDAPAWSCVLQMVGDDCLLQIFGSGCLLQMVEECCLLQIFGDGCLLQMVEDGCF